MTISRSERYIRTNPRFALTALSSPRLQRGQETMVYKSFGAKSDARTLEHLAESCSAQRYEQTFKRPIPPNESWLFLRMSILYHLKRLQEKEYVREL